MIRGFFNSHPNSRRIFITRLFAAIGIFALDSLINVAIGESIKIYLTIFTWIIADRILFRILKKKLPKQISLLISFLWVAVYIGLNLLGLIAHLVLSLLIEL